LKAIGNDDHAVAHGFRSTLKDWVHETRDYPAEVIEQALVTGSSRASNAPIAEAICSKRAGI
jgi:hypothetical protein